MRGAYILPLAGVVQLRHLRLLLKSRLLAPRSAQRHTSTKTAPHRAKHSASTCERNVFLVEVVFSTGNPFEILFQLSTEVTEKVVFWSLSLLPPAARLSKEMLPLFR